MKPCKKIKTALKLLFWCEEIDKMCPTFVVFCEKNCYDNHFLGEKKYFSTKDTIFMSELLPNENGFKGKKSHTVKIIPITKTPIYYTLDKF